MNYHIKQNKLHHVPKDVLIWKKMCLKCKQQKRGSADRQLKYVYKYCNALNNALTTKKCIFFVWALY